MNFSTKLSERIGMKDIIEILSLIEDDPALREKLYSLAINDKGFIGYQATWVLTHVPKQRNEWLCDHQNELIDELLACNHHGKKRLLLSILYNQAPTNPLRVDLLDLCLERMVSTAEMPGMKSLCIKIAYKLCRSVPELMQELKICLEMMDGNDLKPAMRSVRNNILKAMQKIGSYRKL